MRTLILPIMKVHTLIMGEMKVRTFIMCKMRIRNNFFKNSFEFCIMI